MTRARVRARSTSLAAAVTALFAVTGGIADATGTGLTYRGAWSIPFSTEASCDTASAARNDPPEVLSYPCSYYTSNPSSPNSGGAGWYYYYRYSIS